MTGFPPLANASDVYFPTLPVVSTVIIVGVPVAEATSLMPTTRLTIITMMPTLRNFCQMRIHSPRQIPVVRSRKPVTVLPYHLPCALTHDKIS